MVFHVHSFYRVQLCSHSLSLMRAFVSVEALVNSLRLHFTARRLIANVPGLLGAPDQYTALWARSTAVKLPPRIPAATHMCRHGHRIQVAQK